MNVAIERIALSELWDRNSHHPPLVVAELSGNHNQSLGRAMELIEAAADCGVDAIKLQTYTPDTITLDINRDEFVVQRPGSVWHGRTLHSLYEEAHTPWEWHKLMVDKAAQLGLSWFSSPFDFSAVDFLETLNVPCYKIASPEIIDLPLIKKCAQTGKPLVMSTGMASVGEINDAVATARQHGCRSLVLLKCTTDYPASPVTSNLRTIPHMAEMFDCGVGVSDHTLGLGAAVAATALGAVMVEKHLTLRRSDGGPDSHFSLEPNEMKALVQECRNAWAAVGRVIYGAQDAEKGFIRGRRSLYITQNLQAGDVLTPENLRSIRPGCGLRPEHYESLIGRRVSHAVAKGTPVDWSMVEPPKGRMK